MDASKRSGEAFELITAEEFMKRMNIKDKETLSKWKKEGWILPERHFIKVGKGCLYLWSEGRLIEMHRLSNQKQKKIPALVAQVPVPKSVDRVNWDY